MKHVLLSLLLLSNALALGQSNSPSDIVQELGAKLKENSQLAIAIIQGEDIQYHGFILQEKGYKKIENKNRIFEIGSITKIFTSMLFAQAIVDQKVKAQHCLQKFVPFKLKGRPKITLEQLSNHTSGLPRLPENMFLLLSEHLNNPYKFYEEQLLEQYMTKELALEHPPAQQFAYSNLGAGLLGYALGRVYKTPYEQLLEELIFKPLQLKDTYTRASQVQKERLVKGLGVDGKPVPNWDWDVLAPAGCILSSVEDLSLFAQAHLKANSPTIQRQQQISFKHNEEISLALGWLILKKEGQEYYFHNGATGGYTSSMFLDKNKQQAVVTLSNVSGLSLQGAVIDKIALSILQGLE
ncbi:MAG: serine hydrolase domain-containing protein [Aureispira sp.]